MTPQQRRRLLTLLALLLYLLPVFVFGQGQSNLESKIEDWQGKAAKIAKALVGLSAIGGGLVVYFRMNTDEGERGKKALMTFIGALIYAVVMFYLIDFFLGTNIGEQAEQ